MTLINWDCGCNLIRDYRFNSIFNGHDCQLEKASLCKKDLKCSPSQRLARSTYVSHDLVTTVSKVKFSYLPASDGN